MNGYYLTFRDFVYLLEDIRQREKKEETIKKQKKEIEGGKRKTKNSKFSLNDEKIKKRDEKIIELWDSDKNLTYRQIAEILLKQWYWLDEDDVVRVIALEKQRRVVKQDKDLARKIIKLVYSKNATLDQLEKIAEYYEVDLNEVLESLKNDNGKDER